MHIVVNCKVCRIVTSLKLIVVMSCKSPLTLSILRLSILDRHVLACCVTDEISRIAL
jgi:hypothetical protein